MALTIISIWILFPYRQLLFSIYTPVSDTTAFSSDSGLIVHNTVTRYARLTFAGDFMQHSSQLRAAETHEGKHDYSASFCYIKPIFAQSDLSIVNLETTLISGGHFTGYPLFRSPAEIAFAFKDAGIDVALLANNHILDGGTSGIVSTTMLLDSAAILHTGVFIDCQQFLDNNPLIVNAGNMCIALLNYTYGTNGLPVPDGFRVNIIDTFTIARDIHSIDRSLVDAVVVFLHWGNEYQRKPDTKQQQIANLCHRLGAEIVIGSHPHVVQPIEYVVDEHNNINAITVYSLGNLVSAQRDRYCDGGLLIQLDISKEENTPLVINPLCIPVWVRSPDFAILPQSVADTINMTSSQRKASEKFYNDTNELLKRQ